MLHLLALLLLLVGGLGSGTSEQSILQGASDAPTSVLDASEFRQRLVLVSLPQNRMKAPTTAATKIESLPDETSPPATPSHHGNCSITVQQTIGGNVASAIATGCKLGKPGRMALEAAALMARPLPYAGFESVFSEDILLEMSD